MRADSCRRASDGKRTLSEEIAAAAKLAPIALGFVIRLDDPKIELEDRSLSLENAISPHFVGSLRRHQAIGAGE